MSGARHRRLPTVEESVRRYLTYRRSRGFTVQDAESLLVGPPLGGRRRGSKISSGTSLVRRLGDLPLDRLDQEDLDEWFEERHRAVGQHARRRGMAILRSWLAYCASRGHLPLDWLEHFKPIDKPRTAHPWLSAEQMVAMDGVAAEVLDPYGKLVWDLLLGLGLRRAEVPALRTDDLVAERRQVLVRGGKGYGDGKDRIVPTPVRLCRAWTAHVTRLNLPHGGPLLPARHSGFVLGGSFGEQSLQVDRSTPMGKGNVNKVVSRVRTEALAMHRTGRLPARVVPLELNPLVLRRTWAAHQYLDYLQGQGGLELRQLSRAIGHSELTTTETYLQEVVAELPADARIDVLESARRRTSA